MYFSRSACVNGEMEMAKQQAVPRLDMICDRDEWSRLQRLTTLERLSEECNEEAPCNIHNSYVEKPTRCACWMMEEYDPFGGCKFQASSIKIRPTELMQDHDGQGCFSASLVDRIIDLHNHDSST